MSQSTRQIYDLYAAQLVIETAPDFLVDALVADLSPMLGERNGDLASDKPRMKMELLPAPEDLRFDHGDRVTLQSEAGQSVQYVNNGVDDCWLFIDKNVALEFLGGGNSRLYVSSAAGSHELAIGDALIHGLSHAVKAAGGGLVHAACLLTPDRERTIMLQASSGTGKTTTSCALALAGFPISGDDSTGIVRSAHASAPLKSWGVPRGAKVHKKTVDMLPALAPLVNEAHWNNEQEQMISRKALRDAGLALPLEEPKPIAAVITLAHSQDEADCAPVRLSAVDAVTHFLQDNLTAGRDGFFPGHDDLFTLFSELAANTPCFRVPVSGPPQQVAKRIKELVAAL
ncbi:MAG: hypothetical protein AAFO77_06295 [Pseudomonadota bacterium]